MNRAVDRPSGGSRVRRVRGLADLSLGGKLALSFGVVLALSLAVAVTSFVSLTSVSDATHQITQVSDARLQAAQDIRFAASSLQNTQFTYVMARGQFRDEFTQAAGDFRTGLAELRRVAATRADLVTLGKVSDEFDTFMTIDAMIWAAAKQGNDTLAQHLALGPESLDFGNIAGDVSDYTQAIEQDKTADVKSFAGTRSRAVLLLIIFTALAVMLSAAVGFMLRRSLVRRVRALVRGLDHLTATEVRSLRDGLDAVAAGDLTRAGQSKTQPIRRESRDEIGDISEALELIRLESVASIDAYNVMRFRVTEMLEGICRASGDIATASRQMADGSEQTATRISDIARAIDEVSRGAERQVASLDEARGMTEQVANATNESASSVIDAKSALEQARALAGSGMIAVQEVTDFMTALRASSAEAADEIRELGEKSTQIDGIVKTITGLAQQTNLLALNAAIEAARAGEQGRGFAVVAEEVRKLAEESGHAAGSIATLIAEIQSQTIRAVDVVQTGARQTEAGATTVERAREAFTNVGESVQELDRRVSSIAITVEQIASSSRCMQHNINGIAEIAEASSSSSQEVSASTQDSSASTQQVSAHAQELAHTAAALRDLVAAFALATRD
jgi:methyl-accepting chemotaxis protein